MLPIRNHIGRTKTDQNGEFSMDVDVRYPVISLQQEDQQTICEADLDLKRAQGAMWVGEVTCQNSVFRKDNENFIMNSKIFFYS